MNSDDHQKCLFSEFTKNMQEKLVSVKSFMASKHESAIYLMKGGALCVITPTGYIYEGNIFATYTSTPYALEDNLIFIGIDENNVYYFMVPHSAYGPAILGPDNICMFYLNGKFVTQYQHYEMLKDTEQSPLLFAQLFGDSEQ